MAKRGKEFNEIYDLTALRVIVLREGKEGERDCYGALGAIHSLWKPMPGRFKDYVAMPKFNLYRSHTTVIGPEGEAARDPGPNERHARHGRVRHRRALGLQGSRGDRVERLAWMAARGLAGGGDRPGELKSAFPELASDEVYVFTPKGEVKASREARRRSTAYRVHTDVGHRTVGAKVNGRIVPLHYNLPERRLRRDPDVEAGRAWAVARLALPRGLVARANKIRQWFSRETKEDAEQRGRETLENALKQHNLPYRKLSNSPLLAQIIREMGFKKAEDFYLALGSGKLQVSQVANKVLHRLKTSEVVEGEGSDPAQGSARCRVRQLRDPRAGSGGRAGQAGTLLHSGSGRRDRRLHLAWEGHHDPPRGLPERAGAPA